jgi:hypothetical protein
MSRFAKQETEAAGSDSFLDVVTNIVGILIILAMVVGIRIKHGPAQPAESNWDEAEAKEKVDRLQAEASSLERNIHKTEGQISDLAEAAKGLYQQRGTFAYLIAEHERELNAARKTLDDQTREAFDLRRAQAKAELDLKRLEQEAADAQSAAQNANRPIKIQSRPTPISHTVFGDEVHFQLRGGRLAWAPLTELAELCHQDAQGQIHRLQNTPEISDTLGPMGGFRARYVAERLESPLDPGRFRVNFKVELLPQQDEFGETVNDALRDNSLFLSRLAEYVPRKTTVTLWTYPDSFVDYSRLKEELYQLGFSVAARPLHQDWYISGSNYGSHSAAQ